MCNLRSIFERVWCEFSKTPCEITCGCECDPSRPSRKRMFRAVSVLHTHHQTDRSNHHEGTLQRMHPKLLTNTPARLPPTPRVFWLCRCRTAMFRVAQAASTHGKQSNGKRGSLPMPSANQRHQHHCWQPVGSTHHEGNCDGYQPALLMLRGTVRDLPLRRVSATTVGRPACSRSGGAKNAPSQPSS